MQSKIDEIKKLAEEKISEIKNSQDLQELKVQFLGKKSELSNLLKGLGALTAEERPKVGALVNEARKEIEEKLSIAEEQIKAKMLEEKIEKETIDITLPSTKIQRGSKHPVNRVIEEIEDLFVSMGYDVISGPELARTMLANTEKTPIRMICAGKTYRREDDATHSHQFGQVEGLVIDKKERHVSLADLKGTLEIFVKKLIGKNCELRFRPSYFPFTEPSYEVDVSCFKCGGKGCSLCKQTGWIEVLGAGIVHPNVLKMNGYDPEEYGGFAFGTGLERLAMFKYGIPDMRYLYSNDIRFLSQFDRKDEE